MAIERVARILRLASTVWRDENGVTWLETAPILIKLDEWETQRKPYPLAQEEQRVFFGLLPDHLSRMALFKINTECRAHDVRRFGDERLSNPERSLRARL